MKIKELTESISKEEIAYILKRDCAKWLNDAGDNLAIRGINSDNEIMKVKSPENRKSTDIRLNNHYVLIKAFEKMGFKANRHNSFFVFGNRKSGYGTNNYGVFPIGNYDFTWSPEVDDLYSYVRLPYQEAEEYHFSSMGLHKDDNVEELVRKFTDKYPDKLWDYQVKGHRAKDLVLYTNFIAITPGSNKRDMYPSDFEKLMIDLYGSERGFRVGFYPRHENDDKYIDKVVDKLKEYDYRQNDDIQKALNTGGHEVMIRSDEAWFVRLDLIPFEELGITIRNTWF